MLTDIIPAAWRARVYAIFAAIATALGAVQVIYIATSQPQPTWLTVALAVLAFVGTAIGAVAKANVPSGETQDPEMQPASPEFSVAYEDGSIATHYSDGTITTDPGLGNPPTASLS